MSEEANHWYDSITFGEELYDKQYRISKDALSKFASDVKTKFERDVKSFRSKSAADGEKSDRKWIEEVIRTGTLSDRVAALALNVQESPIHNLQALDELIALGSKKEQRPAELALKAIIDLLVHNLLPDRHLRTFLSNPLGHPKMDMSNALLLWYESELLQRMPLIVTALDNGLKSTLEYYKKMCMELVCNWLIKKPEQEARLLTMLVNKLGDPKGQISSKCIELLRQILDTHEVMKNVIILEVRQLLVRTSLTPRAVYNAITFLSQIPLSVRDKEVATHLMDIYSNLFEQVIHKDFSDEGIETNNTANKSRKGKPYMKYNKPKMSAKPTKAAAVSGEGPRLLSLLLTGISRAFPIVTDQSTVSKNLDSIFRIVHKCTFATATRALLLLSNVAFSSTSNIRDTRPSTDSVTETDDTTELEGREGKDLRSRFYRALYSKLFSDEMCTRSHNAPFLNLLYRSIKKDPSVDRAMAFIKRLLITATHSSAPITAALLLLVSEVLKSRPILASMLASKEQSKDDKSVHAKTEEKSREENTVDIFGCYDASKREPQYAVSASPSLWEISLMSHHFHPSVHAFSKSLLSTEENHQIQYDGDPTADFSLSSFLQRFSYKTPKKQHLEKVALTKRVLSSQASEAPVNSIEFQMSSANDIAPEKVFFFKYFGDRNRLLEEGKIRNRNRRKSSGDSDDDDIPSDVDIEEFKIDKFADKLADDLLRGESGDGPDMDDDDYDDGYFSDSGDDEVGNGRQGDDSDDNDDDDDGDVKRKNNGFISDDDEEEEKEEEDGLGEQDLETVLMDDGDGEEDDETEMRNRKRKKKLEQKPKKKKARSLDEDFADASLYEADINAMEMELQESAQTTEESEEMKSSSHHRKERRQSRTGKRKAK